MVSISHIPTYADGAENVYYSTSGTKYFPTVFTLRYEIQPASLAHELASSWENALSIRGVYTLTRATSGDYIPLTIDNVSASDGTLTIVVPAKNFDDTFFAGTLSAMARLKISDGIDEIISDYVPLIPTIGDDFCQGDYNFGHGVTIDGVTWAPVNCGATPDNPGGKYYKYSSARSVCPKGWRLPTDLEFDSLSQNYSDTTTVDGRKGRWLSGQTKYSSSANAIFLPAMGYYTKEDKYGNSKHESVYYIMYWINDGGVYKGWCGSGNQDPQFGQYNGLHDDLRYGKVPVRCVKE